MKHIQDIKMVQLLFLVPTPFSIMPYFKGILDNLDDFALSVVDKLND